MREVTKYITVWIFVCVITVVNVITVEAGTVPDSKTTEAYLNTISGKLMSTYTNPGYGASGGDWTVMALARDGSITKDYVKKYKENLLSYLKKCNGILSENKYTEYSRVVMAITAIGEDATAYGGYDLVKPLYDVEKVQIQGMNGISYALIALDSGNYDSINEESGKLARDKYVSEILNAALENGGWSPSGDKADADMTAICIQALTPYMDSNYDVKKAVEMGISALSDIQCESGGFATLGVENCESIAQVLVAISGVGISVDDKRFVKNGNTIFDAFLQYYTNGSFSHIAGKSKNAIATDQAMYALVAYYRSLNNKNSLYDMKDGLVYRTIGNGFEDVLETESVTNNEQNETSVENIKNSSDNKNEISVQTTTKNRITDEENRETVTVGESNIYAEEEAGQSEQRTGGLKSEKKKNAKKEETKEAGGSNNEKETKKKEREKSTKKDLNKEVKSTKESSEENKKKESVEETDKEEYKKINTYGAKKEEKETETSGDIDTESGKSESIKSEAEDSVSQSNSNIETKLKEAEYLSMNSEEDTEQNIGESKESNESVTETMEQTVEHEGQNDFVKVIIPVAIIIGAGVLDKVLLKLKGKRRMKYNDKETEKKDE